MSMVIASRPVIAAPRPFKAFTRSCHKSADANKPHWTERTDWQQKTNARPRQACIWGIKSGSFIPKILHSYHNLDDAVNLVSDFEVFSMEFQRPVCGLQHTQPFVNDCPH